MITSNPICITDTSGRRVARYVAGVSSPAVWYWSRIRGDLAEARRRDRVRRGRSRSSCGYCLSIHSATDVDRSAGQSYHMAMNH